VPAKDKPPVSPAIPRPGNRPYYIDTCCPECGTPLVLVDILETPNTPIDKVWHDEFICPVCLDGIYMDWPKECLE